MGFNIRLCFVAGVRHHSNRLFRETQSEAMTEARYGGRLRRNGGRVFVVIFRHQTILSLQVLAHPFELVDNKIPKYPRLSDYVTFLYLDKCSIPQQAFKLVLARSRKFTLLWRTLSDLYLSRSVLLSYLFVTLLLHHVRLACICFAFLAAFFNFLRLLRVVLRY